MQAYADTAPELADTWSDGLTADAPVELSRLLQMAQRNGDVCDLLTAEELTKLGADVVQDYDRDDATRGTWKAKTEKALKAAAQEDPDVKTYPWAGASNVRYPLLSIAAQQFQARAYPAVVKGDESVGVKVIGDKPEKPRIPDPAAVQQLAQQSAQAAQELQTRIDAVNKAYQANQQRWDGKNSRAKRVRTFLNYQLFYQMEGWEDDIDVMLGQLPVSGTAFKKVYYDADQKTVVSEYVNPLHLTVAMDTKSLQRCPRITQDYELYPHEIRSKQKRGIFREIALTDVGDDPDAPRCILEQHRLEDLDDDGIAEPYIVTVDKESSEVLRLEACFSEADIEYAGNDNEAVGGSAYGNAGQGELPGGLHVDVGGGGGAQPIRNGGRGGAAYGGVDPGRGSGHNRRVVAIKRWVPFVKYAFLRSPQGHFYEVGFGQMLEALGAVVDTLINQLLDAGHAQNAGGGFIASGVRLQGMGQNGSSITFQPSEYKTVNVPGNNLKSAIWERTIPEPSQVLGNMLELLLGAAKEMTAVKDVLTGDAPTTAPVGTTQMLIEQGLQAFTAIYKRFYRSLREELRLIYDCFARYGGHPQYGCAKDYADIVDDPEADFAKDFSETGHDIVPVSDPTVVTRMQAIAKAQFVLQIAETPLGQMAELDGKEIIRRAFEAGGVDDIDSLFGEPPQPNPLDIAKVQELQAKSQVHAASAGLKQAEVGKTQADTVKTSAETIALHASTLLDEASASDTQAAAVKKAAETAIISGKAGILADRINKGLVNAEEPLMQSTSPDIPVGVPEGEG